jgi:hypothetical protein
MTRINTVTCADCGGSFRDRDTHALPVYGGSICFDCVDRRASDVMGHLNMSEVEWGCLTNDTQERLYALFQAAQAK